METYEIDMSNPYATQDEANQNVAAQVQPAVRMIQIISFALIVGPVLFGCFVLLGTDADFKGEPSVITWMAVGLSGLMMVNHFVIPRIITTATLKQLAGNGLNEQTETEKIQSIMGVFQSAHIVGFALLEGAAFFALIAWMLESTQYAVGAAVILIALMVIRFPTASRISFWVEDRLRELSFS